MKPFQVSVQIWGPKGRYLSLVVFAENHCEAASEACRRFSKEEMEGIELKIFERHGAFAIKED